MIQNRYFIFYSFVSVSVIAADALREEVTIKTKTMNKWRLGPQGGKQTLAEKDWNTEMNHKEIRIWTI